MKLKQKNMTVWAVLILAVFATNSFAYPKQTLTTEPASAIKIIKTEFDRSRHPGIVRSPNMINRLRLIFSSNQKDKITR